jgi:hypothetical protein
MNAEQQRLKVNASRKVPLEPWGTYLPERQWGTVREDYSANGDAWNYFPFDHAHFRAYRWGEDGIGGICDYFQNLCFGISLWNGKDPILKERLFGLGNYEGNHGEDVKELYYYLDNLPSHYYAEMLYKYPQQAFPYEKLRAENAKLGKLEVEYELLDTGIFDNDQYFDVKIIYSKLGKKDIAIRIDITNRYSKPAPVTLLPTLWFFNRNDQEKKPPQIKWLSGTSVKASHGRIGNYYLYFQKPKKLLFTDNITNAEKLNGTPNGHIFVKDAFHGAIIKGKHVVPLQQRRFGTKCAPVYQEIIEAGATKSYYLRLSDSMQDTPFGRDFSQIFEKRKQEANDFYNDILPAYLSIEKRNIQRQALAGLLWSKQFYYYDVEKWLTDPIASGPGIEHRKQGRNHQWQHLKNQDIVLMPDKWEYPWYAAWDLAFHCIAMATVDPVFAKHQLILVMREWYMKPDGQLPAYEWNFSDVNPPVHAFAALRVYQIEKRNTGKGDIAFLKRIFQKLIVNFTWWINRKDPGGNNLFEGGFLGLDNIGVFNRSIQLHSEMQLDQADGTSWMGMYALNMMDIALEIAMNDKSFEDSATRYFEHFVLIAEALNELHLWNEEDKFYYDTLCRPNAAPIQLRIQSIVGLSPLFAVSIIDKKMLEKLDDFNKRISWFEHYRKSNGRFWPNEEKAESDEVLLSLLPKERLVALLQRMLNEAEFLSSGGIRALSKYHQANPYTVNIAGNDYTIQYDPGDSTSSMFGGNSNWRGPVWLPINYLIIKSLQKFGDFYGDNLIIEYPVSSGKKMPLKEAVRYVTERVVSLFLPDEGGKRKLHAEYNEFYQRPGNEHLVLFYEYFNGDSGRGLGASHQTGWTALVANLLNDLSTGEKKWREDVAHAEDKRENSDDTDNSEIS